METPIGMPSVPIATPLFHDPTVSTLSSPFGSTGDLNPFGSSSGLDPFSSIDYKKSTQNLFPGYPSSFFEIHPDQTNSLTMGESQSKDPPSSSSAKGTLPPPPLPPRSSLSSSSTSQSFSTTVQGSSTSSHPHDKDAIERLQQENAWLNDVLISKVETISSLENEYVTYKEDKEKQLQIKEAEKNQIIARARERLQNWSNAYQAKEKECTELQHSLQSLQMKFQQEKQGMEQTIERLKQALEEQRTKVNQYSIEYQPDLRAFTNVESCERALTSIEKARVEITQVKVSSISMLFDFVIDKIFMSCF
jgi:hypothetical protein